MQTRTHVIIDSMNQSSPILYSVRVLETRLPPLGYPVVQQGGEQIISLLIDNQNIPSEGFAITSLQGRVMITGGDGVGVIYGSYRLLEMLRNGAALEKIPECRETAKLSFRAIKFDLPWDTYRKSTALDLHDETCRDPAFWEAFLDMMCQNRLNALTLWNLHPYPFLIKSRSFPEASPFTDKEMDQWRALFSSIFSMAQERGIDTYIMPFNIFVTPEFARAHNVAMDNLEHDFKVEGDISSIIKEYTRDCVSQMLQEYPLLTGIGLTLGEGMCGMTPQEREDWVHETIIEGMARSGRKAKLLHRIPFSGTTSVCSGNTLEMEQITREKIEEQAKMEFIQDPVWAGLKFNWSHPLSTTRLVKVHGGELFGAYFDPVPTSYKVFWTARNEDAFCLRWGVPEFIREHIALNSHAYVGGYMIGSETYIPARDYFTAVGYDVPWRYAFERQWFYYMIWGRLLYDRDTPEEVFLSEFVSRFGSAGPALREASSLAGKTLLRLGFSFDIEWDFTLYAEAFMARNPVGPRVELISVDRLISQPPLDPRYVRIADFVTAMKEGKSFSHDRITPLSMAADLVTDCTRALGLVKEIDSSQDVSLMFEVADVKAWSFLGLYFAEKIRGAVALETFRHTKEKEDQQKAVNHLNEALRQWDSLIEITRPLYNDMPLVHYSEQDDRPSKENDHLRFHWEYLRSDVIKDIEFARK